MCPRREGEVCGQEADRQPVIRAVSNRQTLRCGGIVAARRVNRPRGAGFQSKVKVIKYSII